MIRPPPRSTLFPNPTLFQSQKALKADPKRATKVGEKWFPAFEASLIATLVERDLPYYDPAISKGTFDRSKSTRLNSSHLVISYAVFCLKKKNTKHTRSHRNS